MCYYIELDTFTLNDKTWKLAGTPESEWLPKVFLGC